MIDDDNGLGNAGQPDDEDRWENRRLCDDGNCIGVIGPDGRCKVCGRPAADLPAAAMAPPAAYEAAAMDAPEDAALPPEADAPAPHAPEAAGAEWETRRLCSDGNCIGVIGPDGRCKVCGRPAEAP